MWCRVSGVAVTAKHLEAELTRAAETDVAGSYTNPPLPVGQYEVSAEKLGLSSFSFSKIRRVTNFTRNLDNRGSV